MVREFPSTVLRAFQRARNRAKYIARWGLFMGRGQELLRTLEIDSAGIIVRNDRLSSQSISRTSQIEHKCETHNSVETQLPRQEPLHWFRRVHIIQSEPMEPNGLALFACVRRFRHTLHRTEPRLDAELATCAFSGVAQETVDCVVVLCCLADEGLRNTSISTNDYSRGTASKPSTAQD